MKKRILCLTLGLMLTISQAVPAGAASRKDQLKQDKAAAQSQLAAQESKINNLEDQKQTLSAEIDQLDLDLVNIMVEIEILDGELSDKEAQIEQTKADLAVAEENKQKQYEAMKKRIQYLYEKGGDDAWAQMLFQASDFTSLLNQAEYVQQMYDSDRNSLEEFKETVQQVKDLGDQLDSEKAELEEMNQEYQNRQASMQTQLEEKKATSSDYDAQIAQAQNQAAQYTELIRQQNAEIQKIEEEEKKAAEEAARKAAEEAAKNAAAEEAAKKAQEEAENAQDALEIIREGISRRSTSTSTTQVRSTITGMILDVPIKVGNSVIQSNTFNDGTTIASVADMNNMIFRGKVDETEVGRIHEGMPIKLTVGALDSRTFAATLEYVAPKGVEENGAVLFEIKAAVQMPEDAFIRAGYSANAEIVLKRATDVLTVPESCVEFSGDSTFVQIVKQEKPEQLFEKRAVTVGLSDGIKIEVKEGLAEGDKIRGGIVAANK